MVKTNISVKLGKLIMDLRVERNISQERLAQLCNSHRNYIGRVERGEQNITVVFLVRLAEIFELQASEMLGTIDD